MFGKPRYVWAVLTAEGKLFDVFSSRNKALDAVRFFLKKENKYVFDMTTRTDFSMQLGIFAVEGIGGHRCPDWTAVRTVVR